MSGGVTEASEAVSTMGSGCGRPSVTLAGLMGAGGLWRDSVEAAWRQGFGRIWWEGWGGVAWGCGLVGGVGRGGVGMRFRLVPVLDSHAAVR